MKKKLLFLAATALLVVNVIFVVKAENCRTTADCQKTVAPPGFTVECIHEVCTPSVFDGDPGSRCALVSTELCYVNTWENIVIRGYFLGY